MRHLSGGKEAEGGRGRVFVSNPTECVSARVFVVEYTLASNITRRTRNLEEESARVSPSLF